MSTTYGNEQEYLGMMVKFSNEEVHISMKKYLDFGEAIYTIAKKTANKNLFTMDSNQEQLNEQNAQTFRLQYTFYVQRLGLEKLYRVMQYIKGTMNLKRIISLKNF